MSEDYPFEDGRNVSWVLEGFGSDEWLCSSVTVTREQYLQVRALFDLGDDEWMMAGVYPVPLQAQGIMQSSKGLCSRRMWTTSSEPSRISLPDYDLLPGSPDRSWG
nr:hypothetical protein KitaXyl93_76670 [Kitasatospora sp. Xyl93]